MTSIYEEGIVESPEKDDLTYMLHDKKLFFIKFH